LAERGAGDRSIDVARQRVVVVGGGLVDLRATTRAPWASGRSLPGSVRLRPGGAARNVAVNLARLGHPVALLSSVGADVLGEWLLAQTSQAGVDVTHVMSSAHRTGLFVTVGPEGGDTWSIADAGPLETLEPSDLAPWAAAIAGAAVIVADANLPEAAQRALAAQASSIPRVLLATSPQKAIRLRPVLAGAAVLVCNRDEALAMTGLPATLGWQALGTALLTEGIERVVLTLGPAGIAVLTADEAVLSPAVPVPVIDPLGAGDAVAAVAVHAHMAGLGPTETGALAAAAAAVVVQSDEATPAGFAALLTS